MMLYDCELWYIRLDPANPNTKFSKVRPSWEIQIRTTKKEQMKEWQAAGLKVTPQTDDHDNLFYFVNLKRRAVKADMTPVVCPELIDGDLKSIDPRTVGNGSEGHVRIFQYNQEAMAASGDKPAMPAKLVSILMGVQVTVHRVYVPKPSEDREEFAVTKTKVLGELPKYESEDDADRAPSESFKKTAPPEGSDKARESVKF